MGTPERRKISTTANVEPARYADFPKAFVRFLWREGAASMGIPVRRQLPVTWRVHFRCVEGPRAS